MWNAVDSREGILFGQMHCQRDFSGFQGVTFGCRGIIWQIQLIRGIMGLCLRQHWVGVSLREYIITCLMGLIAAFVSKLAVYHSPAEYICRCSVTATRIMMQGVGGCQQTSLFSVTVNIQSPIHRQSSLRRQSSIRRQFSICRQSSIR